MSPVKVVTNAHQPLTTKFESEGQIVNVSASVNICAKFERILSGRFLRKNIHEAKKKVLVWLLWPWPLTFNPQNLISSSLSPTEHLN